MFILTNTIAQPILEVRKLDNLNTTFSENNDGHKLNQIYTTLDSYVKKNITLNELQLIEKEVNTILGCFEEKVTINGQLQAYKQLIRISEILQENRDLSKSELQMFYLSMNRLPEGKMKDEVRTILHERYHLSNYSFTESVQLEEVVHFSFDSELTGKDLFAQLQYYFDKRVPKIALEMFVKEVILQAEAYQQYSAVVEYISNRINTMNELLQQLAEVQTSKKLKTILDELPLMVYQVQSEKTKQIVAERLFSGLDLAQIEFNKLNRIVTVEIVKYQKSLKVEETINKENIFSKLSEWNFNKDYATAITFD